MTLPSWMESAPAPRVAPKLRLVVELGEGHVARAVHSALLNAARVGLAGAEPGSIRHAALAALLAGRIEEVPRG